MSNKALRRDKVTIGKFCGFQCSSPRHRSTFRVHPFLQAPFRGFRESGEREGCLVPSSMDKSWYRKKKKSKQLWKGTASPQLAGVLLLEKGRKESLCLAQEGQKSALNPSSPILLSVSLCGSWGP